MCSSDLRAYSDAYRGATRMEFNRDIKDIDYPLTVRVDDGAKLEELGLLGNDTL